MDERNTSTYRISLDLQIAANLVGYWKKGSKQPTMGNLVKLADYFQVSIDYLVGRSDDPKGGIP